MRRVLRGALGFMTLSAVGLLTLSASGAHAQRAERELLGIRLWNKYSDVLLRYGQPTRIENGLVMMGDQGGSQGSVGGPAGMAGMGGPGMMGGPGSMRGSSGMSSMMGGSGSPYGGGGPGRMTGMGGKMGGMMGGPGGMMGGPGMSSGGGGAIYGGGPAMGTGAAPGLGDAAQASDEARSTWIYERGPVSMYFVFNKDGRVIQIESSTHTAGAGHGVGVTSSPRSVTLGDPMSKVYAKYGWAKMLRGAPSPILDYTRDYHVGFLFDDVPGKGPVVTGIAVTLLDNIPAGGAASGIASGGAPAGMMGMMGRGGPAGMMSSGGGKPRLSPSAGMGMPGMGMPGMSGGGRMRGGGGAAP